MGGISEVSDEQRLLQYQEMLDEQHEEIVSELNEIVQYGRDINVALGGANDNLDTVCDNAKLIAENTGASKANKTGEHLSELVERNYLFYKRCGLAMCIILTGTFIAKIVTKYDISIVP
jgi:hypothetical protein